MGMRPVGTKYFSHDLLQDISLVKTNIEFAEQADIFIAEGLLFMMLLLIVYVFNHCINLRMGIRKGSISLLPSELAPYEVFVVYPC